MLRGDLGNSIKMQKNRPVLDIILEMFPVSAQVGVVAILWAVLVGVPLGCLAAYRRGTWVDSLLRVICTIGISMPGFVVATMLLHLLCGTGKPFRPCLSADRWPVMCCPARRWVSIRCVISPGRPAPPCWTPSIRSTSRPPGPRA